ncbi:MAG: cation:proton antiporter [Planctomycetes bacterium]|nr:cation:proton antiporter [Planctomycetota bacterium]
MSEHVAFLLQIALVIALARLCGELLNRIKQPPVLGELLAGMLLGPTGLGAVAPEWQQTLFGNASGTAWVANLGLVLLMLLTGLETDVRTMRNLGRAAFTVSLCGLLIPFGLGAWLGYGIELAPEASRLNLCLFLGVAMAVSAMPVIAKILIDLGLIRRNFAVITLSAAVVDDTVGWVALALISGLVTAGAFDAAQLGMTMLYLTGFLLAARYVMYPLLRAGLPRLDHLWHLSGSELVLIVFVTLLCAAATEAMHVHAVFGAFVAGMVLRQCPTLRAENFHKLEQITLSMFSPLFFGLVGLEVNLWELQGGRLLILVCVLALVGKLAGCLVGGLLGRMGLWESLAVGVGMSARGAVGLVVAKIGKDLGILDEELFSVIVVMSLLTSFIAPLGLRAILGKLKPSEEERLRERGSTERFMPSGALRMLVLAGGGGNAELGCHLAARMCGGEGDRVTVLRVQTGSPPWWRALQFWLPKAEAVNEQTYLKELRAAAGSAAERLNFQNRPMKGSVLETVLEEAARGYQFIVVGASGHRHPMFDPFLTELIRRSPCHVLVVRNSLGGTPADGGFKRLLVPTNGSYFGDAAFECAARYAREEQPRISLLFITESSSRHPLLPSAVLDRTSEHGRDMMRVTLQQQYAERVSDPALLDCHVRDSQSMVTGLVEQVDRGAYDLVVMGAAAKALVERLSLGPNIEAALEEVTCATVVVIPKVGAASGH